MTSGRAYLMPILGGVAAWLASWSSGGSLTLNLAGLLGISVGLGMYGWKRVRSGSSRSAATGKDRRADLDELEERLKRDWDPRTQQLLKRLRANYDGFQKAAQEGKMTPPWRDIINNVESLFAACVKQLERTYDLWTASETLADDQRRQRLLARREQILEEIEGAVQHLESAGVRLHGAAADRDDRMSKLREELDESLRVARRTEERLAEMEREVRYDESEFE